jgi:hypothetical protein
MLVAETRFVALWDWAGRFSVAGVLVGFTIAALLRVAGSLVFASDGTAIDASHCGYDAPIPLSGLAGGRSSGLSLVSSMAFSAEGEADAGEAPAPSKRWRRVPSPRAVIIFTAMGMGAVAGLVGRATTDWTGFGVGLCLFALLVVFGTPYLYGPLTSPAELRRLQAELAEQTRREAGAE